MKQISKITLASLAIVLMVLVPACRTKKKDVKPAVIPTTDSAAPNVEAPPAMTQTSEPVEARPDFVNEKPVVEEMIPADIESLNTWARQKGYIRDAFYTYDEATLDDAAQAALSDSAAWLKGRGASYGVLIEGHCDERGTEQYNLALGDRRANTAKDYLVTLGIDEVRIRTVSYGEERAFDDRHDESAWAQNRRAHLVLVRGK